MTKAESHPRRRAPAGQKPGVPHGSSGRTQGRLWPAQETGRFDEVHALLLAAVTTGRSPQRTEEHSPSRTLTPASPSPTVSQTGGPHPRLLLPVSPPKCQRAKKKLLLFTPHLPPKLLNFILRTNKSIFIAAGGAGSGLLFDIFYFSKSC